MGPAEQREVREVGGAAVDPVPQMMGVTPGQRPLTAREDTAAVPDGQGGPLGRLHHPGAAADVQGPAGGPAQDPAATAPWRPAAAPGARPARHGGAGFPAILGAATTANGHAWVGGRARVAARVVIAATAVRMVVAGGLAADHDPGGAASQASRRHPSGPAAPRPPGLPPRRPGSPSRLSRSTVTSSWGRTPPALGNPPPSRARAAQLGQGISGPLATLAGVMGSSRAGQRLQSGLHNVAGLRFQQPIHRRPCPPRSATATPPAARGGARPGGRPRRGRRPGTAGRPPGAAGADPGDRPPRPGPSRRPT